MKKEEGFYDIISSKFEEDEVPFNAEDWKSMKMMLDASRSSRKNTVWLIVSICLLLCAAGGTFAVYKNNRGGNSKTSPAVSSAASTSAKSATHAKQNPNSISAMAPLTATDSKIVSNNNHDNKVNVQVAVKRQSATNGISRKNMVTYTSPKQEHVNGASHAFKPGSQTIALNTVNSSANGQSNELNQGSIPTDVPAAKGVTENSNVPSMVKPSPSSNVSVATTVPVKTTVDKPDSTTTGVLPQRFSEEPRIYGGKANIFSIEAGAEYSGGWQIGSAIQGKGFNPIVGVGYARYLGGKVFLKTGIQFSTFGNMSSLAYNYQHSVGNVIYDSVITTKRLYFLRIPLQLEYAIGHNKKSSIGLGGAAWFLLGNSGSATTYQQIDNNPPVNIDRHPQNTPLSGYSKVNASAYALYKYSFTRNLSMSGILYFEMTSMEENSFFGGNIIERTHGFEVMASYSFN